METVVLRVFGKAFTLFVTAFALLATACCLASVAVCQEQPPPAATPPAQARTQTQQPPAAATPPAQAQTQEQHPETTQPAKPQPAPAEPAAPAKPAKPLTLREQAQTMLNDALSDASADRRARAVAALGLLPNDPQARRHSIKALKDEKSEVRAAAATALGSMHAVQARHELEAMLDDSDPTVVLAAANSLLQLKDRAAYQVYYGVLTGEQKASKGFVQQELAILHDKKKIAQLGLDEGIGFVPFAGIPYTVLKMVLKDTSAGARAAAAQKLASDPDPASGYALVDALADKSWVVRVAALEALAHRRDSSLLPKIAPSLSDDKEEVRLFAAACVVQLSRLKGARQVPPNHPQDQTSADLAAKSGNS